MILCYNEEIAIQRGKRGVNFNGGFIKIVSLSWCLEKIHDEINCSCWYSRCWQVVWYCTWYQRIWHWHSQWWNLVILIFSRVSWWVGELVVQMSVCVMMFLLMIPVLACNPNFLGKMNKLIRGNVLDHYWCQKYPIHGQLFECVSQALKEYVMMTVNRNKRFFTVLLIKDDKFQYVIMNSMVVH